MFDIDRTFFSIIDTAFTDLPIYRLLSELMQRSLKVQANRSFRDLPIVVNSCSSGLITKKHTLDSPKNHGKNRIEVMISRLEIGSMDSIGLTNQI